MNQRELIVDYIKKHGSITNFECYEKLGITKLATRISEMERNGDYVFKKTWIDGKTRWGKRCRYFKYELEGEKNDKKTK